MGAAWFEQHGHGTLADVRSLYSVYIHSFPLTEMPPKLKQSKGKAAAAAIALCHQAKVTS